MRDLHALLDNIPGSHAGVVDQRCRRSCKMIENQIESSVVACKTFSALMPLTCSSTAYWMVAWLIARVQLLGGFVGCKVQGMAWTADTIRLGVGTCAMFGATTLARRGGKQALTLPRAPWLQRRGKGPRLPRAAEQQTWLGPGRCATAAAQGREGCLRGRLRTAERSGSVAVLTCWPGWARACMRVLVVSTGNIITCSPIPSAAPDNMCC